MCRTVRPPLRNNNRRNAQLKFHNVVAVATLLCGSENMDSEETGLSQKSERSNDTVKIC